MNIEDSVFSGNSAGNYGGALYIEEGASCNVANSLFKFNVALNGSCFTLDGHSSFIAESTEFIDNVADYGSIGYVRGDSQQEVTMENCVVKNNEDNGSGILIYEEYKNNTNKIMINEG